MFGNGISDILKSEFAWLLHPLPGVCKSHANLYNSHEKLKQLKFFVDVFYKNFIWNVIKN